MYRLSGFSNDQALSSCCDNIALVHLGKERQALKIIRSELGMHDMDWLDRETESWDERMTLIGDM